MRLHGQRNREVAEWHKEIRVPEEVICIHIGFFVAALVEVGSDNPTLSERGNVVKQEICLTISTFCIPFVAGVVKRVRRVDARQEAPA